MSVTIQKPFHVRTSARGRKVVTGGQTPAAAPVGRVPRITKLMALAIKFDDYLRRGVVKDYAELARLGHVTRARITQIMDLNLLAPDIQEAILNLSRTVQGRDRVRERQMRQVISLEFWCDQRRRWRKCRS